MSTSVLKVYLGNATTPCVIETNLAWAVPYWNMRKVINPNIRTVIV